MADGIITVEVSTQAAQAELERLRAKVQELEECLRISGENYRFQEAKANKATAQLYALRSAKKALATGRLKAFMWTLKETVAARQTTVNAHLWFSDPQNSAWEPLYTAEQLERELEAERAAVASEWETRPDGKQVRKDRWEFAVRRIVSILWGPRHAFELDEVVDAVRALKAPAGACSKE